MDKVKEKKLRIRMANTLGDLAESIIRKKAPFTKDIWPITQCNNWYINYFYKYGYILSETEKEKYLSINIEQVKFSIRDWLRLEPKSYVEEYPEDYKFTSKIDDLVKNEREKKEGPISVFSYTKEKVKVNKLAKEVFKERYPDFIYNKEDSYSGTIAFHKAWFDDKIIFLNISTSNRRQYFYFNIGLLKTDFYFSIDMCTFWAGQSKYEYSTNEEFKNSLHKALDMLDIFLPHFEERLEKALKYDKSSAEE
ncbi:MAG: hypothetical protein GY760_06870 [Deltaproteobacteria bacterium]|nr:hypothetical protein [Deltaproteobacteria bacterium]